MRKEHNEQLQSTECREGFFSPEERTDGSTTSLRNKQHPRQQDLHRNDSERQDCSRFDDDDEQRCENDCFRDNYKSEEREAVDLPLPEDIHDMDCQLALLQLDMEEEQLLRDQDETLQRDDELRVLAVLDELSRIHDQEYPDSIEYHQPQQNETEIDSDSENNSQSNEDEDNEQDDHDVDESDLDLHRILTPELVAMCDQRDRDIEVRALTPRNNDDDDNKSMFSNSTTCVVCLTAPRTHAYVPCGHLCVCVSCAKQQKKHSSGSKQYSACPVCQQLSTKVMRIFIP